MLPGLSPTGLRLLIVRRCLKQDELTGTVVAIQYPGSSDQTGLITIRLIIDGARVEARGIVTARHRRLLRGADPEKLVGTTVYVVVTSRHQVLSWRPRPQSAPRKSGHDD
jgi:hypothetical protein